MKLLAGNSYHIYNQGNNQESLFHNDDHYHSFLNLFKSYVVPHCHIICWCLMPNHFHFLIYTDPRINELQKQGGLLLDPVTNGFRKVLSAYAHLHNLQHERSGALFRPKTKAKCLTDKAVLKEEGLSATEYFAKCFHYMHNNPVAAGLVVLQEEWKWSSYRFYIGRRENSFCNKDLTYKLLGTDRISF